MDEDALFSYVPSYFRRRSALQKEIAKLTAQYKIKKQKYKYYLYHQNFLICCMQDLYDTTRNDSTRSIWSYSKSGYWWSDIVPSMTDKQFKDNFRIHRATFKQILENVEPYLKKQDTKLRRSIPADKRLACALYSLGSTSELRTIAHLFGIGKSTAVEILHEFCDVMVDLYFNRLVKFPITNQEIKETIDAFNDKYSYPMCIGSIDGTHISIEPPSGEETDYFNYKKHHSVIVLAVVNADLKFTYINVGAPGRCNDAFVYNRSKLFDVIKNPIYSQFYMVHNTTRIQAHLVADSAFPLSQNLMKPYAERVNMPRQQSSFNY